LQDGGQKADAREEGIKCVGTTMKLFDIGALTNLNGKSNAPCALHMQPSIMALFVLV